MQKKSIIFSIFLSLTLFSGSCFAITSEEIISQLKEQNLKVKDMSAYYTQTSQSTLLGDKPVIEKGRLYKKGYIVRKEMQSPTTKLSITSPEMFYEKDENGKETKQDIAKQLAKLPDQMNVPILTPEEALDKFQFALEQETDTTYILKGSYQQSMVKLEINKQPFTLTKIRVFLKDQEAMQIINTYTLIDNIPVVNKSENHVSISLGKEKIEMSTATEYKGIKINQNLPDSLFKVQ